MTNKMNTENRFFLIFVFALFLSRVALAGDVWLAGDFDADGVSEDLRVSDDGSVYSYLSSGKIMNWQLVNASGTTVRGDQEAFLLAGDFDGDGGDELRGLMAGSQWQDIWKVGASPAHFWGDYLYATPGSYDPNSSPKVNVNALRHVVAGDFNNDDIDELWAVCWGASSAQSYVWGFYQSPSSRTLANNALRNMGGANLSGDNLVLPTVGKFCGGAVDMLLVFDVACNWYYAHYYNQANAYLSYQLNNNQGTAVAVSCLKYVLPVDVDQDGVDEWWGITAAGNANYVWKRWTNNALKQGSLLNSGGAAVWGNYLDRVSICGSGSATPVLCGLQGVSGAGAWSYEWGWSSATANSLLDDGPVSNANAIADLPTETPRNLLYADNDCPEKPLTVAAYFLHYSGADRPIAGKPVKTYTPANLYHQRGQAVQDYWIAYAPGSAGYLSYGPYVTHDALRTDLGMGGQWDRLYFHVDFELMVADNSFSNTPVGNVDLVGRDANGVFQTIRLHNLYPQDLSASNSWQNFSFDWPDFYTQGWSGLEFRIYWQGGRTLAVKNIVVTACEFDGVWSGWTGLPAGGGTGLSGDYYRQMDPQWIVGSQFNKDGTVSQLTSIDWWRRDIVTGHSGFYPYIGPYDQLGGDNQEDLLRYQIRQAKAAGLDGFKVYVYYLTRDGDTELPDWDLFVSGFDLMLDVAQEEDFGLFLDDSSLESTQSGNYDYDDAINNLRLVARKGWLDHAGYLKRRGRPLYALPVTHETVPANVVSLIASMNAAYRSECGAGKPDLFTLVTAMTTWGQPANPNGPYNLQELFLYSGANMYVNWSSYFTCSPGPSSVDDLLARGRCLYDSAQPVSGYGVLLATLLERKSAWRYLSGVTCLGDWCGKGAMVFPQVQKWNGTTYVLSGTPDLSTTRLAFEKVAQDAHQYFNGAILTISPGHDKSNAFASVNYAEIPRSESPGSGSTALRFRRMLSSALAAHPDVINIENWNGYPEAVQIEPCEGFVDDGGNADPDIYLKILAQALGQPAYDPSSVKIPAGVIDPIRAPYIPASRKQ